ncbi:MAG: VTT domain-containing protein [Patescibacteria group bacterium]
MESVVIIQKLEEFYLAFGYPVVFLGSLAEATPIAWVFPGGLIVAIGGFYAYSGHLSLLGILGVGFLGELSSFLLAYFLGYQRIGLVRLFKQEKNAKRAGQVLQKHGPMILTTSMMAGLTRFFISYVAGQQRYNFLKFVTYASIASFAWTALMVVLGYIAGSKRDLFEQILKGWGVFGWALVILAIGLFVWKAKKEYQGETEIKE